MKNTLQTLKDTGVVAIARRIPEQHLVPMAQALYEGGVRLLEITFDQAKASSCIHDTTSAICKVRAAMGDRMAIGAGTVLTVAQAKAAVEAGAEFLLSATVDREVIEEGKRLGAIMIPGAMTPTEIENAYRWGADAVKVFPVGILGVRYLKDLSGPLPHIPFLAVGGINEKNMLEYIKAGAFGVGVAGNLMRVDLADSGRLEELTELAQSYTRQMHEVNYD